MLMDDHLFRTPYPHGGFLRPATPSVPPAPLSSQPKKVVSIPIQFVGSEKLKSDSALKIQKAFRGFRVRKNVKKILAIQRELDLVEKKLQERETVELIKKDDKERLKMNESLMALLFKLDSVRSVNDSVRDCRKAAIKKAIMLQERIDSFVASVDDQVKDSDEIASETIDNAIDEGELNENMHDSCSNRAEILQNVSHSGVVEVEIPETLNDSGVVGVEFPEQVNDCGVVGAEIPGKVEQADHEAWDCVGEVTTEEKSDFVELSEGGNSTKRSSDEWFVVGGDGEESKRSKKLLEKMAEDNQKLMAMVAELCDRNAAQASLISSLSQRVEQLEKLMNDSLRKKKKKKNHLSSLTHTTGS